MIGNPINYDKKFKDKFPIFPAKFDPALKRYLHLIPGKEVLDLGIGQGTNSIPLAELGFNVTGVDYSIKYLEICKNNCNKLKNVLMPSTVKQIGRSFNYCTSLGKIEIPNSIETINGNCFLNSLNLKEIIIHEKKGEITGSPWGSIYGDRGVIWDE